MATVPVNFSRARAIYPPVAESTEILGYINDVNGIGYSRDIGRSSILGGHHYYVFGDTFCKNERDEFVGLTSNTVAIVPDKKKPLESAYMDIRENGMVNALVPLSTSERLLEEQKVRVILWAFGGIAETRPDLGWTWYQNAEFDSQNICHYHGVGLARVSVINHFGQLQVARCKELVYESPTNRRSITRCRDLIFGPIEPRFGTFSTLVHNDMVYLWGDLDGKIYLARVSKYKPTSRSSYEFWDGLTYVSDWQKAVPVMEGVQHGEFVHSPLFGVDRPWIFIGCTKWADSQVMIGAEGRLEGPWHLTRLFTANGIHYPDNYMYCIYPHFWSLDSADGQLLVTWSEHWPGGVVGAKVNLAMAQRATYWARVPINKYGQETIRVAAAWATDARVLVKDSQVQVSLDGHWVAPGTNPPPGTDPLNLLITGASEGEVADATYVASVKLEVLDRRGGGPEEPTEGGQRAGRGSATFSRAVHWVGSRFGRESTPKPGR